MKPICKECNIEMDLHETTKGLRWICDNYAYCGQSENYEKKKVPSV